MRWKNRPAGPSESFLSEKTFLVIKDRDPNSVFEDNDKAQISKPKFGTANANTWPLKIKKIPSTDSGASLERPKTANLSEPSFLDPSLVDKLDMSILSKELLLDSMTHIQLLNARRGVGVGGIERRRQSLNIPSCPRRASRASAATSNSGITSLARQKRRSFEPVTDSETYHCRDASRSPEVVSATMKKQTQRTKTPPGTVGSDETILKRHNSEPRSRDDNNNRRVQPVTGGNLTPKISPTLSVIPRRKSSKTSVKSDVEVFVGVVKNAPEPCKTCGRSDQPERFHSHPKNAVLAIGKVRENANANNNNKTKIAVPKSVQKPIALNFRSEKRKVTKPDTPTSAKDSSDKPSSTPSPKRGPRTVTCYICSREFGTASFPIHEPKCLQKWERENNALPPSQRRPAPPQRPQVLPGHQGWNEAAWEQSQAQLLPCSRCGRTFLPDRLPVHEKSCKTQRKNPGQKESEVEERVRGERAGGGSGTSVTREPPMVFCQICGRSFGSRSIKIHEPQCLKRWQAENDGLPHPRLKKDPPTPTSTTSSTLVKETRAILPQKKAVPCYICGRDFGSTSISIHEPQCLRKWHQENDKLPRDQRRQQPEKPDIVFTSDGTGARVIDHAAMAEANWRSHLGQLVPCERCGRTFNPDRVAIHERADGDCDFVATFHRIWENHLNSLIPCLNCGRTFRSEALMKHEPHCDVSYYRRSVGSTIDKKRRGRTKKDNNFSVNKTTRRA